jgi:bacterioferritin
MAKARPAPASAANVDADPIVAILNRLLELELAGVVRFNHYALMVFGHARIPIVAWLRSEATEAMAHAQQIGEWITALGAHPSLRIGPLLETQRHEIDDILREVLEHEGEGLAAYRDLLAKTEGRDLALEEFARGMIARETQHLHEVRKMLRRPGALS